MNSRPGVTGTTDMPAAGCRPVLSGVEGLLAGLALALHKQPHCTNPGISPIAVVASDHEILRLRVHRLWNTADESTPVWAANQAALSISSPIAHLQRFPLFSKFKKSPF